MRRYGNNTRSKADKRAAATQFIIMSDKPDDEKVRSLVTSYGFSEPEARAYLMKVNARSKLGGAF